MRMRSSSRREEKHTNLNERIAHAAIAICMQRSMSNAFHVVAAPTVTQSVSDFALRMRSTTGVGIAT